MQVQAIVALLVMASLRTANSSDHQNIRSTMASTSPYKLGPENEFGKGPGTPCMSNEHCMSYKCENGKCVKR